MTAGSADSAPALTTQGGTKCPACRAEARPRADLGDFRLFACAACGCWSSDAQVRGARTSFEPNAYFANAEADRARWVDLLDRVALGAKRAPRVLDVGCGTGEFLRFLAERLPGSERCGIELDPLRARAAAASDPGARIATGAVSDALAELPGEFDLITLWDVFEHLADPGAALAALGARLAPGGSLFLQTIHEESVVPRLGRAVYAVSAGRLRGPARRTHEAHHLVFFSRRSLGRLADAAGLRIRERWFERLARTRMDGSRAVAAATSALLAAELALGGGLFISLVLERSAAAPSPQRR
jgi:2-polyprenyl-3-methyl-5-hydroxy-6-metoxy-1,4-benzoquinol methylase